MHSRFTGTILLALLATPAAAQDKDKGAVAGVLTTEVSLQTRGANSQAELLLYLEPKDEQARKALGDGKGKTATVTQKKLQFEPRLLAVQIGTKVEFLNEDRVTHNVFLEHDCCKLDSDMEQGQKKEQVFEKAGTYPIVCRLHPEMTLTVVALETPHFAGSEWKKQKEKNADGKRWYKAEFEIKDVPPGEYTLRSWNKKLEAIAVDVTVKAGETAKVATAVEK